MRISDFSDKYKTSFDIKRVFYLFI